MLIRQGGTEEPGAGERSWGKDEASPGTEAMLAWAVATLLVWPDEVKAGWVRML